MQPRADNAEGMKLHKSLEVAQVSRAGGELMGLHAPLAGGEQREAWRASGAAVRDEPTAV